MSPQFDVLVVGGGIVGLTAALALARRNYSLAILDAKSLDRPLGLETNRVYALNTASMRLLEELNVWQELDKSVTTPYRKMFVWDGLTKAHIEFDSRINATNHLGHIVKEQALKDILLQKVYEEPRISLFPNTEVSAIQEGQSEVSLSSPNGSLSASLLIIADGARSLLTELLTIQKKSWSYEQHAITASVRTEKKHHYTAYQVFHPAGPLAFLPLDKPNECSIVWSADSEESHFLMGLKEEEFNKRLTKAFSYKLGATELISARQQFPLQMKHVEQYVGKRWLVMGDAAHTFHPLAGLGLNTGLADIATWLHCLDKSGGHVSSTKALGCYQRARKSAVWQTIWLLEGLKQGFASTHSPVRALRAGGMRLLNQYPFIKSLLIQHASGGV